MNKLAYLLVFYISVIIAQLCHASSETSLEDGYEEDWQMEQLVDTSIGQNIFFDPEFIADVYIPQTVRFPERGGVQALFGIIYRTFTVLTPVLRQEPPPTTHVEEEPRTFERDSSSGDGEQARSQVKRKRISKKSDDDDRRPVTKKLKSARNSCHCKNNHCSGGHCWCVRFGSACTERCACAQTGDCENTQDLRDRVLKTAVDSCRCKKTKCDKRYCECMRRGKSCDSDCVCKGCKNPFGARRL